MKTSRGRSTLKAAKDELLPTLIAAAIFAIVILFAVTQSNGQGWAKDSTAVKATQCTAQTKAGYRCSRFTKSVSKLCFQHERMQAIKKERGGK